ncbi:MAG: hypothetical protein ACREXY_01190 [Gammaproteobacteria bacterium]
MEVGLAHRVLGARESRLQGEGAGQSETELGKHWEMVSTQLAQIAKKAKLDQKARFTSLAHLLTPEFLKETWRTMAQVGSTGKASSSLRVSWNNEFRKSARGSKPAPTGLHRFGG